MSFLGRGFFLAVAFIVFPVTAKSDGSAADLDGLPSMGWPLGVPMTCHELTDVIGSSLKSSVAKLQQHCNEQNENMRTAGYRACGNNECLDSLITTANGRDHGALKLQLGRSEWAGAYFATLQYSYPGMTTPTKGASVVCFDPAARAAELLRAELETWDFERFVEFCVK